MREQIRLAATSLRRQPQKEGPGASLRVAAQCTVILAAGCLATACIELHPAFAGSGGQESGGGGESGTSSDTVSTDSGASDDSAGSAGATGSSTASGSVGDTDAGSTDTGSGSTDTGSDTNTDTGTDGNLSANKTYAYFLHVPGHDGGWYYDGPHAVHTSGLGTYSTGELTDGVLADGATDLDIPSPVVCLGHTGPPGAVATEIIVDLEVIGTVQTITMGTSVRGYNGQYGGAAPDDVDISFSTSGDDPSDFGPPVNYPLWDFVSETLKPGGHHEKDLAIGSMSGRYVKFAFDGAADGNRYMLDEITVFGSI